MWSLGNFPNEVKEISKSGVCVCVYIDKQKGLFSLIAKCDRYVCVSTYPI